MDNIILITDYIDVLIKSIPCLKYTINLEQEYIHLTCGTEQVGYPIHEFIECFNDVFNDLITSYTEQMDDEVEENARSNGKR